MKRGAEKQISKDDFNEDQEQEETPQVGFTKADEAVLKTRPMRGLPKRASAASVASVPPPSTEAGATDPQKFNGFSGFGGASSFSAFSTTTPSATSLFSAPAPTSTARSLASFLASSPNPSTAPKSSSSEPSVSSKPPALNPTKPPSAQKDATVDPAELAYYTSLRGLNQSFRSAVGKFIDDDPFVDLISVFEQYKSLRADIQKKFDGSNTSTTAPSSAAAPTTTTNTQTSVGFTFGGSKNPSSTENKPVASTTPPTLTPGSGFTPTFSSGSSSSIFGGKSAETKQPESKTLFGAPSKDPEAPVSSLPFPLFSKTPEEKATTTSFFGNKAFEDKKQSSLPTTTSSFATSSNLFKTDSSSLSGPAKSDEKPKPFTFGSPSFGTSSFTAGAPSTGFSFSLSSTPATSAPTPAVKPSTDAPSTSRFAGFAGFGKPPPTSTSTTPVFGFTAALPGPSASLATTVAGSSSEVASGGAGEAATTPTSEEAPPRPIAESFALNADNKHDQEGAGEEDEETVHSVKLKSYVLREDEDKKNWVEMGYGVLRLKKHKDTGARRVLLRSSSTGQILINFTFHSAFKPAQKAKNVTFLGYDAESKPKMYTLKTQTEPQARDLKEAFDREIQAKEATE